MGTDYPYKASWGWGRSENGTEGEEQDQEGWLKVPRSSNRASKEKYDRM